MSDLCSVNGIWVLPFGEAEELVVRAVQTRGNGRTTRLLLFELSTVCMAGFGDGGSGDERVPGLG